MTVLFILCGVLLVALFMAWQVITQLNFEKAILLGLLKTPGWTGARKIADLAKGRGDRIRVYGALIQLEEYGFLESKPAEVVHGIVTYEYRVKPWGST